jgi:glycosyltransferase involved in cell wall biosynthesis
MREQRRAWDHRQTADDLNGRRCSRPVARIGCSIPRSQADGGELNDRVLPCSEGVTGRSPETSKPQGCSRPSCRPCSWGHRHAGLPLCGRSEIDQPSWIDGPTQASRVMFLVGFNRNRDSYQVPLALAEIGDLGLLVTDYYRGSLPIRPRRLDHRVSPGISSDKTRSTLTALGLQGLCETANAVGLPLHVSEWHWDRLIARRLRREASRHPEWDLLIYSSFAGPAFKSRSRGRRILFQFSPFPTTIRDVLLKDAAARGSRGHDRVPAVEHYERMYRRDRIEVQAADTIICTSTITRHSLEDSGLPSAPITVIPYGCPDVPDDAEVRISRRLPPPVRFLLVGGGPPKGVHHLIDAWRRIDRRDMTLDLVLPNDSDYRRYREISRDRITVRPRLSARALDELMWRYDVLVLPSLIEGFGRVLTEALAHGCHLVSTINTGLPDLSLDERVQTMARVGDVDSLAEALLASRAKVLSDYPGIRLAALEAARSRPWASFRQAIVKAVS